MKQLFLITLIAFSIGCKKEQQQKTSSLPTNLIGTWEAYEAHWRNIKADSSVCKDTTFYSISQLELTLNSDSTYKLDFNTGTYSYNQITNEIVLDGATIDYGKHVYLNTCAIPWDQSWPVNNCTLPEYITMIREDHLPTAISCGYKDYLIYRLKKK